MNKAVNSEVLHEKPLVTFALFSYNQEKYIREAVEGALAQDYSPLEVIISDDCSTDQTFNIIQRLVRSYKGPHRVIARQTKINIGTLLHVADVAKNANGKLFVLGAGDDVSKENRVTVIQEAWRKTGAWGLSSKFDRIDEKGSVLERGVKAAVIESHNFGKYFFHVDGPVRVVHGGTSAYDLKVFEYLELQADDYVLSEDGTISVLLNLIGRDICHIDESLVMYRESNNSLTNSSRTQTRSYTEIIRDEHNIERFARSQANRCRLIIRMDEWLGSSKVRSISIIGVATELLLQENIINWYKMSIADRILAIFKNKVRPTWALPRILGRKPLYLAKWLTGYLK